MKSKKSIIIVSLIVLLGVATLLVVMLRGRNHTFKQDFQVEAAAYPGAVTKIFMADKENHKVMFTYGPDSLWYVDDGYVASQKMMDLLLETLAEMRIRNKKSFHSVRLSLLIFVHSVRFFTVISLPPDGFADTTVSAVIFT